MRKDKILMLVGSLMLIALYFLPLWKITLVAPQYPEPLGLNIHINTLTDGIQFNDVKNIDLLNHYIGMAHLPTEENVKLGKVEPFKEFIIMPIVVGLLIVIGIGIAFIGRRLLYILWLVLLSILGSMGIFDFYFWLQKYGSNLDPNAILKLTDPKTGELMAYNPPVFGYKRLLNFDVYSYPSTAVYFIIFASLLVLFAIILNRKNKLT